MRDRALRALLVVACVALAGALLFEALTRPRLVSYDSFNYVDVARNAAAGRGLEQSALGYNASRFVWAYAQTGLTVPFTQQPPLYPLAIAGLIRAGLEPVRAALLVPLLALAAVWLFGFLLARRLWGTECALAGLVLLLLPAALPGLSARAWSELPAIAFALLALWLEARAVGGRQGTAVMEALTAFAAGLAAGAAFATRYLFAVALPVGLVGWRIRGRRGLDDALAFGAGFTVLAAPVLARNRLLAGSFFGGERNASSDTAVAVLGQVGRALFPGRFGIALAALALLVTLVLAWLLARRAGSWRAGAAGLLGAGRWLAPAWALTYLAALVALRALVVFDDVGIRLLSPFLALAALGWAALAARALALRARVLLAVAIVVALAAGGIVTARALRTAPVSQAQRVARSPRLAWIRDHVAPRDVLVGDDAVDLPLYFRGPDGGPRRVVSFSPAPYMRPLTDSDLASFAWRESSEGRRPAWLVLRRRDADAAEWRALYGPLVADLATGRMAAHPWFHLVADLDDALVFRIGP